MRGSITSYCDSINIIMWFDKWFAKHFVPDESLNAWLLNRNRNAWILQYYWNQDLALKVNQSFSSQIITIDEIQIRLWITIEITPNKWRIHPPQDLKNFYEQKKEIKWMITFAYDHQGIFMRDRIQCGIIATTTYCYGCMQNWVKKMTQNTQKMALLRDELFILYDNTYLHLDKAVKIQTWVHYTLTNFPSWNSTCVVPYWNSFLQ